MEVWQEARQLRREIYTLTKRLPPEEKYVLLPQMRRAALSVTNNIAEGHGRYHSQENAQFLRLAKLLEQLRAQIIIAERLINGYIRYLLNQKAAAGVRETPAEYLSDLQSPTTDHQSPP